MRNLFAFILIVFFLAGCSGSARQGEISGLQQDSYANIKSNLEFLASDELEGREATRLAVLHWTPSVHRIESTWLARQ